MVPTWFPKRKPNRSKIEAKIDQFLNASWKWILKGFQWILEAKENHVEPKWHPKSIPTSNNDFLKKHCFSLGKTMILKVLGIEVGSQNPSKINQKSISTWEGLLTSIFHRFSLILEAKMKPSWEEKSIKNRSKRDMKKELARCPAIKGQGGARDAPRDARDAPGNFQTHPRGPGGSPPHSLARLNLNASPRGASTKYRTKFQGLDKYLLNAHTPLGGGFLFESIQNVCRCVCVCVCVCNRVLAPCMRDSPHHLGHSCCSQ